MRERESTITKAANCFFYMGVVLEVLMVIIDKSAYTNPIEGRLFQVTFLLFLMKVCLTRYSRREYLVIFLMCLLGAVSYFVTGRNEVVRLVIFATACKDVDMDRCLKMVFYMTLAGCGVIILLSASGLWGSVSLTQEYGRGGVETRYTLGMGHPNALQCMVWALTTLGLYLYGCGIKWYHYLAVLAVNMFFFLLTNSRTSLLVTLCTMVLVYMAGDRRRPGVKRVGAWLGAGVTVFSIGISVAIAGSAYRVYNYVWHGDRTPVTRFYVWLNEVLNGRIRILVENDGFEGTVSTWRIFSRPENNYYFDMGWIRLFYWYGTIPACIFIVVLLAVMIYCYRKKQYMAIMLISSFALYSVIEAHAISVYLARNYVFFLIGMFWSPLIGQKQKGKG